MRLPETGAPGEKQPSPEVLSSAALEFWHSARIPARAKPRTTLFLLLLFPSAARSETGATSTAISCRRASSSASRIACRDRGFSISNRSTLSRCTASSPTSLAPLMSTRPPGGKIGRQLAAPNAVRAKGKSSLPVVIQ